jgi:hypothetical protein
MRNIKVSLWSLSWQYSSVFLLYNPDAGTSDTELLILQLNHPETLARARAERRKLGTAQMRLTRLPSAKYTGDSIQTTQVAGVAHRRAFAS